MTEDPGKMFLTAPGSAAPRPDGVLQGLSQDLLQQAMHEVSQQNSASVQEVKEEPGIYNRMERILANREVRLADISQLHTGDPLTVTDSLDKVKLEPHQSHQAQTPKIVTAGGGGGGGGGASQMILIPTLQSDGTVVYAVQQNTRFQPSLPGQGLINQTAAVIPSSQTGPSKVQHKVGLLRHNSVSIKPKNILPKTFQPLPAPAPLCSARLTAAVKPPRSGARVAASESLGQRKIQVGRPDGGSKTVALAYSGSDGHLSQLELHQVQSVIRQAQSGQQVYRVVAPRPGTQADIVNLEEEEETVGKGEVEDKEQHFSVAAFVREFSSRRGRGKKLSRGRPRKGTSRINEKKVITELRREFGIRNEWSRLNILFHFKNTFIERLTFY